MGSTGARSPTRRPPTVSTRAPAPSCATRPPPAAGASAAAAFSPAHALLAGDLEAARRCLPELLADARQALHEHRPGQVFHCHAASWTREPPFAPDLVTRLHQYYRAPWDGHSGVDPRTGEPVQVAPAAGRGAGRRSPASGSSSAGQPAERSALSASLRFSRSFGATEPS